MTFRQFAARNVLRNIRKYAAYFVSSAFSVMVFFLCALFAFHPAIKGDFILRTAANTMLVAEGVIYLFCFLFVLVSVGSFLQSRRLEFGLLLMHGMTKRQLHAMIFLENMLIGSAAILTGTLLGLLLGKLFLMIGSASLGIAPMPFYLTWQAPVLTVSSFALLFVLISLASFALLRSGPLPKRMHESRDNGAPAPRASGLGAAAAVLLLALGYVLAARTGAALVEFMMFPVVAITVAGTYLFYTQLSLYAVQLLRRIRRFYYRRMNMVTFSGLAHRWKDNGRMFFLVTIVSAVSFTSVGVFASIHTLSGELELDYPAAVGYVAKGEQDKEETEHLAQIRSELEARKLAFETLSVDIKYAAVASQTGPDRTERLPLIAFSAYKQAVEAAGFASPAAGPSGTDGWVMIGSQRDKSLVPVRHRAVYTLEQGISVRESDYTPQVPIAEYLLPELDGRIGGDFSGLVVSDELYAAVRPQQTDRYTGFYTPDLHGTVGIAAGLARSGKSAYEETAPYALVVSGTLFEIQRTQYSAMLLASLLAGTVFFIAAGSFLYFRLYMDLEHDRQEYAALSRMGLTDQELDRSVTLQLALLFFVPVLLAIVHSLFAFIALQKLFYLSIAAQTGTVLGGYLAAQGLYFWLIRNRYLRNLKKNLI
ncbi:ABC transporter permease [Paenibacillus sp. NFR01]|uniref:ABC transporter permease n=1 Tax=Paenibacillus sp. NFR01 TaxID=1566279 RepID=UPI0008C0516F|nr:FtsX-like permease family protein [Paenibacillus sp. NFR01]SET59626.1 putative ABC transport system permease protein [Paenibacillus sp. NFR01]